MKVGLIRCMQTEDICSATVCLKAIREKSGAFQTDEQVDLLGISTCGGCPGKRAVIRAAEMVKYGCDTIVLSSCITRGSPLAFPCPHAEQMISAIQKKVGENIHVLTYSH